MEHTYRIQPEDSVEEMLIKMSEGNPGAMRVLMDLAEISPIVDPQNLVGAFGPILNLDVVGLYGPNIWMLYKDVCGEDYYKVLVLLRSCQIGLISKAELIGLVKDESNGHGTPLSNERYEEIEVEVRKRLQYFAPLEENIAKNLTAMLKLDIAMMEEKEKKESNPDG